MRGFVIVMAALAVLATSCGSGGKKGMIAGKWQMDSVANPKLNEYLAEQRQFIDTVTLASAEGKFTPAQLDSAKAGMRAELDSLAIAQQAFTASGYFEFRTDGVAFIQLNNTQQDSAQWKFDEEGFLILDEQALKHTGEVQKVRVDSLSDNRLILTMDTHGEQATIYFHKVKE
jgi:hypothetical protein